MSYHYISCTNVTCKYEIHYLGALVVALPAILYVYHVNQKYILRFAIVITIHNIYWLITYFVFTFDGYVLISVPVLIAAVPLNIMLYVLYTKISKNAMGMGQEGNQSNYNATDVPITINYTVYEWLNNIGLPQYHNIFVQNGIEDNQTIMSLTKEDLMSIGIDKLGHRNKIMNGIQNDSGDNHAPPGYQGGNTFYG